MPMRRPCSSRAWALPNNLFVMHGVGIDLVDIGDVRHSLIVSGERYLNRVFTPGEIRDCGGDPARLAERFAAKEATMKALGQGIDGFDWRSIEVVGSAGRPAIRMHGQVAQIARTRALGRPQLSVTRAGDHAAAVVVMEASA